MKFGYIICIFFFSLLCSCEEDYTIPKLSKQDSIRIHSQPDQVSRNFKVIFIDSSFTKAVLTGTVGRIYNQRKETLIDSGLVVEFKSRHSGKRVSILTADSARIDDNTKNMLARGNVVVVSDSTGTKLETTLLEWNNTTQKLYSTEYVVITTNSEVIRGWGFESDQNLDNYSIKKVSGEQR